MDAKLDSSGCFTYLVENAPLWIKSLEGLESRIHKKGAEVARVAVPAPERLKKSSSNESIRPSDLDTSSPSTGLEITSAPQPREVHQPSMADLLSSSRKRKTHSVISAVSGTHKYRSRSTVTVYYDSEVQDAFDRLVRNISNGRNGIRKSRMADRVATFAGMDSLAQSRNGIGRHGTNTPDFSAFISRNLRSTSGEAPLRPPRSAASTGLPPDAREQTDRALDKAQGFCERGAHQFLRDGDCSDEISGAKAAFKDVLMISQAEIERMEKQAIERKEAMNGQLESKEDCQPEPKQRESISQHSSLRESSELIEADDVEVDEDDEYGDLSKLPFPPFKLLART